MICKASKFDFKNIPELIYQACETISQTVTGETEEVNIYIDLIKFYEMEENIYSYNNIFIYKKDNINIGMAIAYNSNSFHKLQENILLHLNNKGIYLDTLERQCFEDEFYIDSISVLEEYRSQGIGKEIFNYLFDYVKLYDFKKISLLVDFENIKAKKLYENLGFKENRILIVSKHKYFHMIKAI